MEENKKLYETVYEDAGLSWISENLELLQQIQNCIRLGDVRQMETIVDVIPPDFRASFGRTPLRHMKNLVNSLIQIMGMTAIGAGVSPAFCIRYMERFVMEVEASESFDRIRSIADNAKLQFCRLTAEMEVPELTDQRIGRVIRHIHENTSRRLTRSELAEVAGLSETYLSKRFRSLTGKTLPEYIREAKVLQAKRMLVNTDESLAEIASYLDFSTQNYFQTVFRQIEGCTPLEYRRRHQK
ncbi:MAG: helix-turn-helix transcriptional regulator [Firmicutes bacterium]|nr:helix-turn-helix transcriptional regulator [Bacillota bacterium]